QLLIEGQLFWLPARNRNCPKVKNSFFVSQIESKCATIRRQADILYISSNIKDETFSTAGEGSRPDTPTVIIKGNERELISVLKPVRRKISRISSYLHRILTVCIRHPNMCASASQKFYEGHLPPVG